PEARRVGVQLSASGIQHVDRIVAARRHAHESFLAWPSLQVQFAVNIPFPSGINHEHACANRIRNVNVAVAINRYPLRVLEGVLCEGEQRRSLPVEFVNELAPRIGDIHIAKGISRDAYRLRKLSRAAASHAELSDEFQRRRGW